MLIMAFVAPWVRATNGPQPARLCIAARLIRASQLDLLHQAAKGLGDGLIPVPGRVLVDQRGPCRRVAEAHHQLLKARARSRERDWNWTTVGTIRLHATALA